MNIELKFQVEKIDNKNYLLNLVNIESDSASISERIKKEVSFNNWLNTKEAAKALGISIRTLQSYRDQCIIPFSQFGREIRYRSSDIEAFLIKHYIKPRFWEKEGVDHE